MILRQMSDKEVNEDMKQFSTEDDDDLIRIKIVRK